MIRFLVNFGGRMTNEIRFFPGQESNQFNTTEEEYLIASGKAERCVAPAPKLVNPRKTRKKAPKK